MKQKWQSRKEKYYFSNNSWKLQNLALNNKSENDTEDQQKKTEDLNSTINQLDLTDLQNVSYNNSKIHVLLKCTWTFLQDSPMLGYKQLWIILKETKSYKVHSSITNYKPITEENLGNSQICWNHTTDF